MDDIISALEEILWGKKDLVEKNTGWPTTNETMILLDLSYRSSGRWAMPCKACAIRGL